MTSINSIFQEVLEDIVDGKSFGEAIKKEAHEIDKVEERVLKLMKEKPGLSAKAYMGLLMKEFRGKIDGKVLVDDEFLKLVVKQANEKLERVWDKIKGLEKVV